MKPRQRSAALLGAAIVLVAIGVAVWLALTGRVDWLASFAKPRIEKALLEAGMEAEAIDIAKLSMQGGRIEHARMRFDGGTVEIRGLEVALGMDNLSARRAGAITIDRLDVELTDLSPETRGAGGATGDSLPFASIEVREWHVSAPWKNTTVRASGSLRATPGADGVVAFDGDFAADEAEGRFAGEFDAGSQSLDLRVSDALIAPEGLLAILRAMPEGTLPGGVSFGWERAHVSGELSVKSGGQARADAIVELARGIVSQGDTKGGIEAATLEIAWKQGEPLSFELEAKGVTADTADAHVVAATLQFVGNEEGGKVSLGGTVATAGEREVRGHGLGSFSLGEGDAGFSAEGKWTLESAKFDGFTAGGSEIVLGWQNGILRVSAPGLKVGGGLDATFEELEFAVADAAGDAPGVDGRAVAEVDLSSFASKEWTISPARERVTATFLGLLGEGRESLRVEFSVADAGRRIETADFSAGASGAISGVLTLDVSHMSGSVAGELKDVSIAARTGGGADFPEVKLKWSTGRVWTEAVLGWAELDPARVMRELLWVSNFDVRAEGGAVDLADVGKAADVAATLVSNGANISERAGGSLVLSAARVEAADRLFTEVGAILEFGLDGGTVVADVALDSPRIPVRSRQVVQWNDGFSMSGTYATETIDLATAGSIGGLMPELDGVSASGTASVSGDLRLGPNGFEAGARVVLGDAGLAWPDGKQSIAGVSGTVEIDSLRPLRAAAGQTLTVASANVQNLVLTDGTVEFGIPAPDSVHVTRLEANTLGGKIWAAPFDFDPADPRPATRVRLDGLRLRELLGFFPDVPASAEGAIIGEIPVAWNGGQIEFGTGFIDLKPGELGRVIFDYDLRMLSEGRENDRMLYSVYRRVEKAVRDLHFNRLRIDLYPQDAPGRSLQIRIAGVTATEDVHAPVELEVNINAPLDRFIKWGTNPAKP